MEFYTPQEHDQRMQWQDPEQLIPYANFEFAPESLNDRDEDDPMATYMATLGEAGVSPMDHSDVHFSTSVDIEEPCLEYVHETTNSFGDQPPYRPTSYPIPREKTQELHSSIWQHAGGLVVSEYMSLADGKTRPPKSLADYRFVPVLPKSAPFLEHNLSSVGSNLITDSNVSFEYDGGGRRRMPFLDGRICLGLAFRDRLVAVCSGGLAEEGPLIVQLQDVSTKKLPKTDDSKVLRSFRYSNGLHSGIDWKPTLVRGWCGLVGRALPEILPDLEGKPVWIQSAINNHWANRRQYSLSGQATPRYIIDPERLTRFLSTYDGTADKLAAIRDQQTRNFQLPESFSVSSYTKD